MEGSTNLSKGVIINITIYNEKVKIFIQFRIN